MLMLVFGSISSAPPRLFSVVEVDIPALVRAMAGGQTSSVELVRSYLTRIERYNPLLKAAIAVNPRALAVAADLDRERARGQIRGPLHGVPIAVKDNIQTNDMPTTGGTLAFRGWVAPYEASVVTNLRAAGAVILAKTTLTELANWVAEDMPNGYNPVIGFSLNPYDPRPDPRPGLSGRSIIDTGGSSSGVGTAASLWAASVGTETSGSILSPSTETGLVGVKPTVGRISRHGIIPVSLDQDTAGPMARTVIDAAIMLGAMEGDAPDAADPAAGRCPTPPGRDYTRFLKADALHGTRLGVPRQPYYRTPNPAFTAAITYALGVMRGLGATIVDPVEIPSVSEPDPDWNLLAWPICAGARGGRGADGHCSVVLKYGMRRDFTRWLGSLGSRAPVVRLSALREWNRAHVGEGALRFGQAALDISDEMDEVQDRNRYEADRARDLVMTTTHGIDAVMRSSQLTALVFPGARGADLAARAGYPTVIVPLTLVPPVESNQFPRGFQPKPSPVGLSFTAQACSEPILLGLAYAFEQATNGRVAPTLPR
jgi:amidase